MPSTGLNPQTLPSPDSCLFSPTLCRDLIEGNHSDKKPPTMTPLCLRVCVRTCLCVCVCEKRERMGGRRGEPGSSLLLPPFNPYTSSPLSLSPPPLKCHVALSTRLPCYPPPPQQAFCAPERRGAEAGRERWGGVGGESQRLLLTGFLGPLGAPP